MMIPDALASEMELLQRRLICVADGASALDVFICDIAAVAKTRREAKRIVRTAALPVESWCFSKTRRQL
jgi:hypothetical protein